MELSTKEVNEYDQFVSRTQTSLDVQEKQDLMLGLAWVLPIEGEYFRLYPAVTFVDCFANTNTDEQSLFTVTGKDGHGKMFTFLRVSSESTSLVILLVIFSCVFICLS